jgi:hypothetical protein
MPDTRPHLFQALGAVCWAVELPGFGDTESGEAAIEAAAHDPVVRAARLEEEGFTDCEDAEPPPPPGRQKLTSVSDVSGRSRRNSYHLLSVTPT